MGSSSSKSLDHETAETPPVAGHRRSYSRNVFQSSCIRPASGSPNNTDIDDDDEDDGEQASDRVKQNGKNTSKSKGKIKRNKKVKDKQVDASEGQFDEWGESSSNLSDTISGNGSSSSQNPSSRFLSHFRLFPGNISSRLRPSSSRSSRDYLESSRSSTISNDEELRSRSFGNRYKTPQGCEFFPSCFKPMNLTPMDEDLDYDNSDTSSIHELVRDTNQNRVEYDGNLYSSRNALGYVEQNVRFSRNLSVGRLRDRVLQRPTLPELLSCPFQPESEVTDASEARGPGSHATNENAIISTTSSSSLYGGQDLGVEITHAREARYHDLLEHRANSLERRRRIRSQVRALQRMGNRFENLSGGHERSCILSGQHRTGHCTCRLNNRDQNDATSARASISRLVLLAEALFEVLDEIHQQSGVLSSRPSLSSIGSVPAPDEVVEALPVKLYGKSPENLNDEDEKCYICLVEYEDGDEVRVLPCHHEFHRSCIDKWLKEIHRICPLCRGDVCKSDLVPAEN